MHFLSGFVFGLHLVVALFFLRFWVRTHDRFFSFFALAFFLLALERFLLVLLKLEHENLSLIYVFRLAAFILIIFAIIEKNRVSKEKS